MRLLQGLILGTGVGLLLFATAPLQAQSSTPSAPETVNPWWAAIIVAAVAVVLELVRRYINGRIDARIEAERAQRTLDNKRYEQDSNIRMERIRSENAVQQSDTRKIELLAGSIESMATSIRDAYQNLAQDRQQAAHEREEFRVTLDGNTNELKRHAEELAKLRGAVETLATNASDILNQIKAIQARIGGDVNDPPLTKLIGEAAEAAKKAADALAHAEQAVPLPPDHPAPGSRVIVESARLVPPDETDKPR